MARILHLSHIPIPGDSRVMKSIEAASDSGHCVYGIGVEQGSEEARKIHQGSKRISTVALRIRRLKFIPTILRRPLMYFEMAYRTLSLAWMIKPSLVHCNDFIQLPIAVAIKLIFKSRLVYDAHELESEKNGLTRMASRVILFVERRLWRFVDSLIVVSPSIASWYERHVGEKRNEVVLNSPIYKTSNEGVSSNYLRETFNIPQDSLIFIYVGGLFRGRGIEMLNDVFRTPGVKASLVYLGYGEYAETIRAVSSASKNIFLHDAVNHDEVVAIVSSADVGLCMIEDVSLSDYYCLPNKLFEYVFAGVPVLASKFPDIEAEIERYQLGVCADYSFESILSAVREFEKSQHAAREVDISSQSAIGLRDMKKLRDLSWDAQKEKLLRLYEETLNSGRCATIESGGLE
jgi:glycosyltransferase involved in cell wall biosynthesis